MALLHVVNRSPHESSALAQCLQRAGSGDTILLTEHGVYAALADGVVGDLLAAAMPRLGEGAICALRPDLEARGIGSEEVQSIIQLVDYEDFVDLAVRYPLILSWF